MTTRRLGLAAGVAGIACVLAAGSAMAEVPVAPEPVITATAVAETHPVSNSGDAADDPAVWVHPGDPAQSLVLGNDKTGALEVYGLDGSLQQRLTTGTRFWGNVDVRSGVTIGTRTLDLAVAYNAGLRPYAVDTSTRTLMPAGDGTGAIRTGGGEGLCLYSSPVSGNTYAFVITRAGRLRQYRLHDRDRDGLVQAALARELEIGSESEGCVADEATGALYVAEEKVGLWRYGAEPEAGAVRTLVDAVQPYGHLAYDVEGLALAANPDGSGYLLASAQNGAQPRRSYFTRYDRQTNAYAGSVRVVDGDAADGCERTDGIAAQAGDVGPAFPHGLFVCQDHVNTDPDSGNQDFKLVALEAVLPVG